MAEQTEGSILVGASAAGVMGVLTDYEAYPEGAGGKSGRGGGRGEGGLARKVAFEDVVPVLGRAEYPLAYRYAPADAGMSWVSTEARGSVTNITGEYLLDELGGGSTGTYRLAGRLWVFAARGVGAPK